MWLDQEDIMIEGASHARWFCTVNCAGQAESSRIEGTPGLRAVVIREWDAVTRYQGSIWGDYVVLECKAGEYGLFSDRQYMLLSRRKGCREGL